MIMLKKPKAEYTQTVIDRGAPDPDPDPAGYPVNLVNPGRIQIWPDPMYLDPAWIWIRSDSKILDPVHRYS